jgi:hypothetical protein
LRIHSLIVSDLYNCLLVLLKHHDSAGSAAVRTMRLASLLVFATAATSQTNTSSADASSATQINRLCNSSISDANASGIIIHDPATDWQTGGRSGTPEHSWAVTITGGNGQKIERQFWYDTAGVNYADDVGMDQDVCAFPNFYLPLNAHRLGQYDPGNCSTVFTPRCIDSVTSAASESALKWTTYSSPPVRTLRKTSRMRSRKIVDRRCKPKATLRPIFRTLGVSDGVLLELTFFS